MSWYRILRYLSKKHLGGYLPYAFTGNDSTITARSRELVVPVFTEHGVLMLSSVLNSERAIEVNIQIMRTFTKLRQLILEHADLRKKIETIERKYDYQFQIVFREIRKLLTPPRSKPKSPIGFHA